MPAPPPVSSILEVPHAHHPRFLESSLRGRRARHDDRFGSCRPGPGAELPAGRAFTAWRILTDPDGKGVGWIQFWGEIRPDGPDHFLGQISAAFYTLDFVALPIPPTPVPTEGRRVSDQGQ